MPDHELDELREMEAFALSVLAAIRRWIAYYESARRSRRGHLRGLAILPPAVVGVAEAIRDKPRYAALASAAGAGIAGAGLTAAVMATGTPPCNAQTIPPPRPPAVSAPAPGHRTPAPAPSPRPVPPGGSITLPSAARPPATGAPTAPHHQPPRRTPGRSSLAAPPPTITVTTTRSEQPAWCRRNAPPGLLRICLRLQLR